MLRNDRVYRHHYMVVLLSPDNLLTRIRAMDLQEAQWLARKYDERGYLTETIKEVSHGWLLVHTL